MKKRLSFPHNNNVLLVPRKCLLDLVVIAKSSNFDLLIVLGIVTAGPGSLLLVWVCEWGGIFWGTLAFLDGFGECLDVAQMIEQDSSVTRSQ